MDSARLPVCRVCSNGSLILSALCWTQISEEITREVGLTESDDVMKLHPSEGINVVSTGMDYKMELCTPLDDHGPLPFCFHPQILSQVGSRLLQK